MGEWTRRGDRRRNSRRRLTRNEQRRRNKLLSSLSPPTSSSTESITRGAMRIKSDYWHAIPQPNLLEQTPLRTLATDQIFGDHHNSESVERTSSLEITCLSEGIRGLNSIYERTFVLVLCEWIRFMHVLY